MKTPKVTSPYCLIQEKLRNEEHGAWKILVACILLNQTSIVQVRQVIYKLFEKWPNPNALANAEQLEIVETIRSLGFYNRRAASLKKMSSAYETGNWKRVKDLPGCGKYAEDSYVIFIDGQIVEDVSDHRLNDYVKWALSLEKDKNEIPPVTS